VPNYNYIEEMKNFIPLYFLILSTLLVQCQTPIKVPIEKKSTSLILASTIRTEHSDAEAIGPHWAVSTQGQYSTKAAQYIYSLGGNAIDAAIAASFTLAVERPHSTGIGGGGFMLYREGKTQKVYAIDFRERAPKKASVDMFVGADGLPNANFSQNGIHAVAVPGLVAGLYEIHQKFGHLSWAKILQPSIDLAQKGFAVYPNLAMALLKKEKILALDPSARKIFLDQNQKALIVGTQLVQKDLALTLKRIAKSGRSGFYQGETANQLIRFSKKLKGLITKKDLNLYTVKWRTPLVGKYKDFTIFSMPPPSSGGVHVLQFLNMLEEDNLLNIGPLTPESIHLAASAFQSAFADRAKYLGDPDFVSVPTDLLISKKYAKMRRKQFFELKAKKANEVTAGEVNNVELAPEHTETTHLSIMDENGDSVSTTQTINGLMGASIVVPGTGIVLNNEMDDFSAQTGASNLFGAIGGAANAIAPLKTPLSSMSPTIVVKNGKSIMSVGAPGGTRIISCVAQTILNYLEFKLPLFESVSLIRYHHQWRPDVLDIDPPGPEATTLAALKKRGYDVQINPIPCNVMAVTLEGNNFHAVADPRDIGTSSAY
jgi:gamma-glutamyltranspeptidase/glutathione hydrolase